MRSLKEIEVNSYYAPKISVTGTSKYNKLLNELIKHISHRQNCCNTLVYNVLELTEPFYSMGNSLFKRYLGELLLRGLVFTKFHGEL